MKIKKILKQLINIDKYSIIAVWFIIVFQAINLQSKVLDPTSKNIDSRISQFSKNDEIVNHLDNLSIDILQNHSSKSNINNINRPTLMLLEGYNTISASELNTQNYESWMSEFMNGYRGFMAAVSVEESGVKPRLFNKKYKAFEQLWLSTPRSKRVFLSYTSKDSKIADNIATVLYKNGYAVYTYREGKGAIRNLPEVTGRAFSESGVHLVLDTENARQSSGVKFEAQLAKLIHAEQSGNKKSWTRNEKNFIRNTEFNDILRQTSIPGGIVLDNALCGISHIKDLDIQFYKDGKVSVNQSETESCIPILSENVGIFKEICNNFDKSPEQSTFSIESDGSFVFTSDLNNSPNLFELYQKIDQMAMNSLVFNKSPDISKIDDEYVKFIVNNDGTMQITVCFVISFYYWTDDDDLVEMADINCILSSYEPIEIEPDLKSDDFYIQSIDRFALEKHLRPLAECAKLRALLKWAKGNKKLSNHEKYVRTNFKNSTNNVN